jgi:hypothetical protein
MIVLTSHVGGLGMPVVDWRRVDAGIFHDFHNAWITELRNALNGGLLPSGYYALGEQHAGRSVADNLTLHASAPPPKPLPPPPASGGLVLVEAPPRVRRKLSASAVARKRRRSLAIRHVSEHRLVALGEIVSPANKDRAEHVRDLVNKVTSALDLGIHVLLVDLFPPGPHDPEGMHGAVWSFFDDEPYDLPAKEPLTLASYLAGPPLDAYLEHVAVGGILPDMPLFLRFDRYINVPLEATAEAAYRGVPEFWRDVLEGRQPPDPTAT